MLPLSNALLSRILSHIQLGNPDYIVVSGLMGEGFYLQVRIVSAKPYDGCRKWYISRHSTISEVVQTTLKAMITASEHEIRENFTYRGKAIFAPHFDVEALSILEVPHDRRNA